MSETTIEINSVLDNASAQRLVVCPYFKRVLFSRECSPSVVSSWNMCSLTREHCGFHGRRLKFRPCFAGVRVVWICSMLVGLPDVEW